MNKSISANIPISNHLQFPLAVNKLFLKSQERASLFKNDFAHFLHGRKLSN